MLYRWDDDSESLLREGTDDVFLGVVQESSLTVSLYRAGYHTQSGDRTAAGHRELLELGEIGGRGQLGFSFHVKDGKLHAFYRNSALNLKKPSFCISEDEMDDIIDLIGLKRADDFSSYP